MACCSSEWPTCMLCVCCCRRLEGAAPRVGATAWRVAAQSGLLACCARLCVCCWRTKQQSLVQQLGVLQYRVACLHVVCLLLEAAGGCSTKSWCNSLARCSTEWPACMLCVCCWRMQRQELVQQLGMLQHRVACLQRVVRGCAIVAGGCSTKSWCNSLACCSTDWPACSCAFVAGGWSTQSWCNSLACCRTELVFTQGDDRCAER